MQRNGMFLGLRMCRVWRSQEKSSGRTHQSRSSDACRALGLGQSGGKKVMYKRLVSHQNALRLREQHQQSRALEPEEREPKTVKPVEQPTEHERLQHEYTHLAYKPWCNFCVKHKAREDKHMRNSASDRGDSVVSFDFCFTARFTDEPKLAVLVVHDKFTKTVEALPVETTGGKDLRHLAHEVCRFIAYLGYQSCTIRSDSEPRMHKLHELISAQRLQQGLATKSEFKKPHDSKGNGVIEQVVQSLRQQCNLLLDQFEEATKTKVSSMHPMHSWCWKHSAFILNRFACSHGQTAYERTTNKPYVGTISKFGELVYARVKQQVKGQPRYLRAMWLTKVPTTDSHVVVTAGGHLVACRSVRASSQVWDGSMKDVLQKHAWDYPGLMAGAIAVAQAKGREVLPVADVFPLVDDGAPLESLLSVDTVEVPVLADEAGIEPTSPDSEVRSETSGSSVQANTQVTAGARAATSGDQGNAGKAGTKNERVGEEGGDERPSKQLRGESPKRARLAQPPLFAGNVSCIVGGEELHHGDVDQRVEFTSEEREVLYEYDNSEAFDTAEEAELVLPSEAEEELLWRPGSAKEPELSQELLGEIDEVAVRMEITRLLRMRVLHGLPEGEIHEEGCRFLSTKFVISWRAKVRTVDGVKQHCWMRRARLVAREFAWLDTQRDALFSPATSTATTRIIPAVYMHKQSSGWILASADIKDAYLTVRQRIPTTISVDIGGATRGYKLLMCVPGQRDGSANWYEDLSTYVTQRLGTSTVAEAPTFFRSPSGDLIFNVHVDDLLMAGSPEAVDNMLAVLGKKYELNVEFLRHEGDEISFLKRKHVLLPGNRLGIEAHPKHVQKMLDMLKLHNVRPRKTPLPVGSLPCDEETPQLVGQEAMVFRQCVGILLYLSGDIIDPHAWGT